ncbi:Mediator of rna polymerase ii transcription subunit [Thalictrum thalictroides]|uniref:Mediator of RNA polymerase II transcription subunit 25 n=1 Tax=Thalictrum thalictroides TaxID=46969 RepID=A0A7J6V336_THATH|nr:Mediator of rna polymerase ii transcription subunit [Thalictrum thalictroides]
MAEKQLIVVVEGTAAMGPYWNSIVTDYIEKIIRCFTSNESAGQWLSSISFTGGGFSDVAIAEGLSEALMMFPLAPTGSATQSVDGHNKHCILVAASNPYPLPTPVYRPKIPKMEQGEDIEQSSESCLADAETVAKSFAKCSLSLSVISPKQLPKLRAIYNAGKRNPRAADPSVDNIKNPYFLVLLSEIFIEARNALSRSGITNIPSNHSPIKMDTSAPPVSGPPPTSISSANGIHVNRQSAPPGSIPTATVKVEPNTVASMAPGPAFPHLPSVSIAASQSMTSLHTSSPSSTSQEVTANGDNVHEFKPVVNANVSILNNLSQKRSASLTGASSMGLQSMGGTPVALHMSNMISSGMVSSALPAAQNVFSPAQSGITSIGGGGSGALVGSAPIAQSSALGSFASATSNISGNSNLGASQPLNNLQGAVNLGQSLPGMNQSNISGGQIGQSGAITQNVMNGHGPSISSGGGTMIPTPGMSQQGQTGMQSNGVANSSATNMPMSQQASVGMQSQPAKYVKVWEGALSGQRQGQPVFITKLEGYRSASASETLAADWPPMMQIVRLISQDHMNNKQYVGKADFLVFRALNQHGFLGQLQEKKLCAVIQLPSQTLLLSVSDKASRLIGMLFPGVSCRST